MSSKLPSITVGKVVYKLPQQIPKIEDSFYNIDRPHWPNAMITYRINTECSERQKTLIRQSFQNIMIEIRGVLFFKELDYQDYSEDILVNCPKRLFDLYRRSPLGNAYYEVDKYNQNIITRGVVNIYGQGMICSTGYPALEEHEILHTFGFSHNPLTSSIMSPYSAHSSDRCKIRKIDDIYINCLKFIYTNGRYYKDCSELQLNKVGPKETIV